MLDESVSQSRRNALKQGAAEWNIPLDELSLTRFLRFADLLEEANKHFNLTRIAPADVVPLQFLDSLALAADFPIASNAKLLDIGTGAGFPGIPIAIAFPHWKVTLLDGTRKRLAFLDRVIEDLSLPHVLTLHARAEAIMNSPAHNARYDIVTSRAVAALPTLIQWMLPFLRVGGVAVAYKSSQADSEIEISRLSIRAHGCEIERIVEITLPGTQITRKLVFIRRTAREGSGFKQKLPHVRTRLPK